MGDQAQKAIDTVAPPNSGARGFVNFHTNPMDNLFRSGKGTPWGEMNTGMPDRPQFEGLSSDPNSFKGQSFEDWRQQKSKDALMAGGQAGRQFQAGRTKMLGGGGTATADTARGLGDINSRTALDQMRIAAEAQGREWDTKVQEMGAFNQAKRYANELKNEEYKRGMAAYANEQGERGQFAQGMGQAIGQAAGNYFGGTAGGAFGAFMGGKAGRASQPDVLGDGRSMDDAQWLPLTPDEINDAQMPTAQDEAEMMYRIQAQNAATARGRSGGSYGN